ncbi:MAG: tRNA (adenosine(37)-N6)-threonylcarbamoyltransferase complex ATPase subunit type 1 TsaE [Porticoccus sp.]|nr:tRNA (adenosine(37)-N6)-threonylcarbamoyltransferase complex ATPase subunit type 1 TsaE [Porticoccus sp.]
MSPSLIRHSVQRAVASEEAMVQLGAQLGVELSRIPSSRALVSLDGDLGAGKTTLCRGVLQAFGHTGAVKSPTYTLVESYQLGDALLHHFDLYRLGDPEELEFIGIRDYLHQGNYCLIEWPNRGAGILPVPDLEVMISVTKNGRDVSITAATDVGDSLLLALDNQVAHKK